MKTKHTKQILQYIENELSGKERQEFELELESNPELKKEYELYKDVDHFLIKKILEEDVNNADTGDELKKLVNETVEEWDEEKETAEGEKLRSLLQREMKANKEKVDSEPVRKEISIPKSKPGFKWYYAAAALAAILIIGLGVWTYFDSTDEQELFAEYYAPHGFVLQEKRSTDGEMETTLNKSVEFYKNKDYIQAAALAKEVVEKDEQMVKARFIIGLTQIETKEYASAVTQFENIRTNFESYQLETTWYLALCYLKLEQKEKAIKLFRELEAIENYYQERAGKILNSME